MIKRPGKYEFKICMNGKYDEKKQPVYIDVCFIPKSIRVENNEKEVFKQEMDNINKKDVEKLRKDITDLTSACSREVIIERYLSEKYVDIIEKAKSLMVDEEKSKDFAKKLEEKINKVKEDEKSKLITKEDLTNEIAEIAESKCNNYVMTKSVARTLLYTFSECIRNSDNPELKVYKDKNEFEDLITEDDLSMLITKWREFREGFEESDAKK